MHLQLGKIYGSDHTEHVLNHVRLSPLPIDEAVFGQIREQVMELDPIGTNTWSAHTH